ncbi:MAG: hypothetical protein KatS3mg081_1053 [Gemmatimonadales bacterium]|nr:hypothetical protein HRbin33_00300 [bacterium HR33]GIW51698.1 MAG: hypothetical protein KatS3mg081_1053 [Gemmatimonadales bacterium]
MALLNRCTLKQAMSTLGGAPKRVARLHAELVPAVPLLDAAIGDMVPAVLRTFAQEYHIPGESVAQALELSA